ncbi:MAG: hypothetical protein M5R36_06370 [Deltaproteobacteria bacterium]|nr:hypothetical protein [Deltaproteobacteria bacterium]
MARMSLPPAQHPCPLFFRRRARVPMRVSDIGRFLANDGRRLGVAGDGQGRAVLEFFDQHICALGQRKRAGVVRHG